MPNVNVVKLDGDNNLDTIYFHKEEEHQDNFNA
jgi:hypothetical protein